MKLLSTLLGALQWADNINPIPKAAMKSTAISPNVSKPRKKTTTVVTALATPSWAFKV